MVDVCMQAPRFRRQLIACWDLTLRALTNLSVHSNRDVRTAAGDALSACLEEVCFYVPPTLELCILAHTVL